MSGDIRPWYRWHLYRYRQSKHVLSFRLSTDPARANGCYRNLLDAMWEGGCELPTDREILWHLAGTRNREQYEEVADLVEACFIKSDDGTTFTSEVLKEEWDSATSLIEKKREAGRSGGQARAKQMLKQDSSTPQALPKPVAVAVAVSEREREGGEDQVREIWFSHPAKSHIARTTTQLPLADIDAIIQAIEADGYDLVLSGTLNYADAVAQWAKEDRRFIVPVNRFYLPTVREYAKDPAEWERKPKAMAAVAGSASVGMHHTKTIPLSEEELDELWSRHPEWGKRKEATQ